MDGHSLTSYTLHSCVYSLEWMGPHCRIKYIDYLSLRLRRTHYIIFSHDYRNFRSIGYVNKKIQKIDGFKTKFVDFIVRWNQLLPDIPLYSNIYHDFFSDKLKNYDKNDIIRVTDAILYAYVTE